MSHDEFETYFDEIVERAFFAGEAWAVTYHTWFDPSELDTQKRIREAKRNIRQWLRRRVKDNVPR